MGITQNTGASSLIKPGVIDNAAARPASPYEGQVIYQKDTDAVLVWNGTAWYPNWNLPWGKVGYVAKTDGNFGTFTSEVDITGMSITFTGVSGRLYRTSTGLIALKNTSAGYVFINCKDSANSLLNQCGATNVAGGYLNLSTNFVFTSNGSTTIRLTAQAENTSGSVLANTSVKCTMIVEDIGPA